VGAVLTLLPTGGDAGDDLLCVLCPRIQEWKMGVQMSFKSVGAVLAAVLILSSMGVLAAKAATNTNDVDGIHITTTIKITTRAQLNGFVLSDAPKTITIDRTTGDMISVTSGLPALDLPTVAPATL
jgi:hypothetical protein